MKVRPIDSVLVVVDCVQSASMSDSQNIVKEKELEILNSIYTSEKEIHQRDIASSVGLSLGMTNAILKRLAIKGFITIRKINNRNIRYVVSPKGVEAITKRSYRYLKRTIKYVVLYRNVIEQLVEKARRDGNDGLMLVGASDLAFVIEHACIKNNIAFVSDEERYNGRLFRLYSESYIPDEAEVKQRGHAGVAFLQDVLMQTESI